MKVIEIEYPPVPMPGHRTPLITGLLTLSWAVAMRECERKPGCKLKLLDVSELDVEQLRSLVEELPDGPAAFLERKPFRWLSTNGHLYKAEPRDDKAPGWWLVASANWEAYYSNERLLSTLQSAEALFPCP